jgi:hypothetical protein
MSIHGTMTQRMIYNQVTLIGMLVTTVTTSTINDGKEEKISQGNQKQ